MPLPSEPDHWPVEPEEPQEESHEPQPNRLKKIDREIDREMDIELAFLVQVLGAVRQTYSSKAKIDFMKSSACQIGRNSSCFSSG
jgi:hypothetical protein